MPPVAGLAMTVPTRPLSRSAVVRAGVLIAIGSLGIQSSSALSTTVFGVYGTVATSSLRMLLGALVLCALIRPRLRGRRREEWIDITAYGLAMAAMNLCLYVAVDRLPLGIAVTLDFLGPCSVAFAGSRHLREGLCALAAVGGVGLMSLGAGGSVDVWGYVAGLGAALFFGLYTLLAARTGQAGDGLDGLALSVAVGALVTAPVALTTASSVRPIHWLTLTVAAVVGVVIPYSVDTIAGRITSARVIGTLFAIDPALGSLVGLVALHQDLPGNALGGIALVAASGALLVWFAESSPSSPDHP